MDEPNPFAQEEEPGDIASVAYRYAETWLRIAFCSMLFLFAFCGNRGLASMFIDKFVICTDVSESAGIVHV